MSEKYGKYWTFVLLSTLFSVGIVLVVTASIFLYLSPKLPLVDELKEIELQTPFAYLFSGLEINGRIWRKKTKSGFI